MKMTHQSQMLLIIVDKAIEMYKKIYEKEEMSEGSKEQKEIEKCQCEVIKKLVR